MTSFPFDVVAFDPGGTLAYTARAADVPFVAVSSGFSDRPVAALGADAVIDSYAELIAALKRL